MTTARYLIRWLPTFLAFPPAGLLVAVALGPIDSPALGARSGAIAGATQGRVIRAVRPWAPVVAVS
ncbi:hypothetical protein [Cellulomonas sp. P5_E12]